MQQGRPFQLSDYLKVSSCLSYNPKIQLVRELGPILLLKCLNLFQLYSHSRMLKSQLTETKSKLECILESSSSCTILSYQIRLSCISFITN